MAIWTSNVLLLSGNTGRYAKRFKSISRNTTLFDLSTNCQNSWQHITTPSTQLQGWHQNASKTSSLKIWRRAKNRQDRISIARPKFIVGQQSESARKRWNLPISTEIFQIINLIRRTPWTIYELQNLNGTAIDGMFYQGELVPVQISKRTVFKMDKTCLGECVNAFEKYWSPERLSVVV
jgi:hypothetical protein